MSETSHLRMTVDEFLVWAEGRPERYELVGGRLYAMPPERIKHTSTKLYAALALFQAIAKAGSTCEVLPDGATVRFDRETAFEPDALVRCGDGDAITTRILGTGQLRLDPPGLDVAVEDMLGRA